MFFILGSRIQSENNGASNATKLQRRFNTGEKLNGTLTEAYLEKLIQKNQAGNHRVAAMGTLSFLHLDKGVRLKQISPGIFDPLEI